MVLLAMRQEIRLVSHHSKMVFLRESSVYMFLRSCVESVRGRNNRSMHCCIASPARAIQYSECVVSTGSKVTSVEGFPIQTCINRKFLHHEAMCVFHALVAAEIPNHRDAGRKLHSPLFYQKRERRQNSDE